MNRQGPQARPPALVIGGMHRSTTSLAASILAAAGIHLGDDLMGAGTGNEAGHFEDNDFYLLHQRILAANGLSLEGFTCAERIDVPPTARNEAEGLVASRRSAGRPWGWKDPRTVLFLDFWAELLPEARWLFVVRPPWEVVDSLFRRGDTAFRASPRFAGDVWVAYNRRIFDFVQARPDRTAVVHADDVVADHAGLVRLASDLLGVPLETPGSRFRSELYAAGQPPHRASLVRAAAPEAYELYRSLGELAGNERRSIDRTAGGPPRLAEVAEAGLIEWNKACQAIAERGGFSALATEARQAADAISQELAAERETVVRAHAHVEELTRDLVTERAARAEVTAYAERIAGELAAERATRIQATAHIEELTRDLVAERAARAEVTAYAERLAADLAGERAGQRQAAAQIEELTRDLVNERAARAEMTAAAESTAAQLDAARAELATAQERHEARRLEFEARLAVADREWSTRLESERARRESEAERFAAELAEVRSKADLLLREAESRERELAVIVSQRQADLDAVQAQLEA
ncbi:MAG: hypothetical protein RLZZ440_2241, partial [Planctomycetota bacterium]